MNMAWLYDLVTWCVEHGREDVENWVAWARSHGAGSVDHVAQRVVSQQAEFAARAPITPAAVASIPGIRQAVDQHVITLDVGFMVYRMVKTVMYQAAVYGHDSESDVGDRILLVLGVALGHEKTRQCLLDGGSKAPGKILNAIVGYGGGIAYADTLGTLISQRFRGRGGLADIPIVGRPFFGAQNFIFISAAALAGRYVFNDLVLTIYELNDLDRQMRDWSRSMIGLMMWMARADGGVDHGETDIIRGLEKSLVLPGIHPEDLEKEMQSAPDWEKIRRQFKTEDERAGLLENLLMVVWADGVKTEEEDRLCRRVAAELVADRMVDDIEAAVRKSRERA